MKEKEVREVRARLFAGLYDASTGHGRPSTAVVRCPRCRRNTGNVTGAGWRRSTCDTCGSTLMLRTVDRGGRRFAQVRLLNPDYTDDDATGRRFALLEIE
jgi:ribosomal protein S27E